MRGNALFPPGKTQLFSSCSLDVHALLRNVEISGDILDHLRQMRRDARSLGDEGAVDIRDFPAAFINGFFDFAQQLAAVDVLVLRVGVGEMPADIAKPGGTEAGVTDGMDQYVGVGMAVQSLAVRDFHAAENQIAPGDQRMHVVTMTDAYHAFPCCCFKYNSANAKSSGNVTLMLSAWQATTRGCPPAASITEASSVISLPCFSAFSSALANAPMRNICGVAERHKPSRLTVSITRPSLSTRLTVSETGN